MKRLYEKYIGYCFNDYGKEVVLESIIEYTDGCCGYEIYYSKEKDRSVVNLKTFRKIAQQTVLPK